MNEIVMPKLSDTMTEGRLVSWKKKVGESVARGEVIAEVETDKANMELEAYVSGELLEIRVQTGDLVPVGTVIAIIGKADEKGAGATQQSAPVPHVEPEPQRPQGEAPAGPPAAPMVEPRVEEPESAAAEPPASTGVKSAEGVDLVPAEGEKQAPAAPPRPGAEESQPAGEPKKPYRPESPESPESPPEVAAPNVELATGAGREKAAPVVRRRARELGIDLAQVQGSGPEGRILLADLDLQGTEPAPAGQAPQAAAEAAPAPQGEGPRPMSRLRSAVAKTVTESWHNIPHFTVTVDVEMDEAEAVRRQLKQTGMPVSVNDLIVKAVAMALRQFPQMNASFTPEGLQFHGDINIAIAVGMSDGVLMPVLSGCQQRSLLEIAQEAKKLVERARSGSLSEQEMQGGTFSVSNLGMFGVGSFSAIIYPSQSGVLAVGTVSEVARMNSGVLSSTKVMKVTLSADHRVIDGAYAAQFLAGLKEILENPVRLLI
uniref:Dihydrolipoamide acetyltransferase component of pyruvate dehydrogenase complex n=1 Tax=Geobacter sp. (strain M21) TaxID=443144 RepID=C6E839_GEOSM